MFTYPRVLLNDRPSPYGQETTYDLRFSIESLDAWMDVYDGKGRTLLVCQCVKECILSVGGNLFKSCNIEPSDSNLLLLNRISHVLVSLIVLIRVIALCQTSHSCWRSDNLIGSLLFFFLTYDPSPWVFIPLHWLHSRAWRQQIIASTSLREWWIVGKRGGTTTTF